MATGGIMDAVLRFDMVAKIARPCDPMAISFAVFNQLLAWFWFFKRLSPTVYICERMSPAWGIKQYGRFLKISSFPRKAINLLSLLLSTSPFSPKQLAATSFAVVCQIPRAFVRVRLPRCDRIAS
jgi:hypothetical protein